MTPAWAELVAAALYVVPIAVVLLTRAERGRSTGAVALDLPFAVALDLLLILAATSVLPLTIAALASRPVWICAGALLARARRARIAWPSSIGRVELATAATAAAIAAYGSAAISRAYLVHDRHWHGPLVAALGGQRLPFHNVYDGRDVLHYHLAGDALAAVLRAFSFGVLSSHRALALQHDILFALIAACGALLFASFASRSGAPVSGRRFFPPMLCGVALLLGGPIALRGVVGPDFRGYAYHHFFNLSFRPHVSLAALLLLGFAGLFALRVETGAGLGTRRTYPAAVSMFMLLSVTDEASTALVGIGAFAAWLWEPELLGASRLRGLFALAGLAVAAEVAMAAFGGALATGGPVHAVTWAPAARVPSVIGSFPPLPLATPLGTTVFLFDALPFAAACLGIALTAWRERALRSPCVFAFAICAVGLVLGTHVDVNHDSAEAQRFYFAPLFVTQVLGFAFLARMPRGSVASFAVLLGAAVPSIYGLYWFRERMPDDLRGFAVGKTAGVDDVLQADCKRGAGAKWFERPAAAFVEPAIYFYWTGCRPSFLPGYRDGPWPVKIRPQLDSKAEFAAIDRDLVPAQRPLYAICGSRNPGHDPICTRARTHPCTPEGTDFVRCVLDAADRAELRH